MSIHPHLKEYERPTTLQEAQRLLIQPGAYPLLGDLSSLPAEAKVEIVVDMQGLGLSYLKRETGLLKIGGLATLQSIHEETADIFNGLLADAARREAGWNGRNSGTLAGLLSSDRGQGPLGLLMACLGAKALYASGALLDFDGHASPVGDFLAEMQIPITGRAGLSYQQVARTPADAPIVGAAARARVMDDGLALDLCLSGLYDQLLILSFSGRQNAIQTQLGSLPAMLQRAGKAPLNDYRGSAAYRADIAPRLARRALNEALAQIGVNTEGAGA